MYPRAPAEKLEELRKSVSPETWGGAITYELVVSAAEAQMHVEDLLELVRSGFEIARAGIMFGHDMRKMGIDMPDT